MWEFREPFFEEDREKELARQEKVFNEARARASKDNEWRRIERPVFSRFWRAIHNLVAHPLLALYRPLGLILHEYTANRMYKDNGKKPINYEAN